MKPTLVQYLKNPISTVLLTGSIMKITAKTCYHFTAYQLTQNKEHVVAVLDQVEPTRQVVDKYYRKIDPEGTNQKLQELKEIENELEELIK